MKQTSVNLCGKYWKKAQLLHMLPVQVMDTAHHSVYAIPHLNPTSPRDVAQSTTVHVNHDPSLNATVYSSDPLVWASWNKALHFIHF